MRSPSPRRAPAAPPLIAALALLPGVALGQQPPAGVAARALLIEQAERASAAGDHRAALGLAERAGRIEMTPSLRMLIAEEQLATGAPAQAMASALQCGRDAGRDAQLPYRDNVLARCRDVARRARASVALVTLRRPAEAPDADVELDGRPVAPELLDVPQPMDPGAHVAVLRARSRRPSSHAFEARSGDALEVPLALGEAEAPAVVPMPPPALPPPALPPPRARPAARRGVPLGAVALMVGGGAALAASAVFFALRGASADGCAVGPDPGRPAETVWLCDTPGQAEAVTMRGAWTALAGASLGVGVAALGAGALWWALGSSRGARPSVAAVPGGAALVLQGAL